MAEHAPREQSSVSRVTERIKALTLEGLRFTVIVAGTLALAGMDVVGSASSADIDWPSDPLVSSD